MIIDVNIRLRTEPFHYIEVEGLYSEEEQQKILSLMKSDLHKWLEPKDTSSAVYEDGTMLKNNKAVFGFPEVNKEVFSIPELNEYSERAYRILRYDENIWRDSWFFRGLDISKIDSLYSYYDNSGYYKPHRDTSKVTALSWFWEDPKRFDGGDLIFPEYNITIPCRKGFTILFPGNIEHTVTEVSMEEQYRNKGLGRFTMTTFFSSN